MTAKRKQRLFFVTVLLAAFGTATALVLYSLEKNLLYFYTPSQVAEQTVPLGRNFNIGGLVKQNSVRHDGITVRFDVTDTARTVPVVYTGLLPDLFREGQGIIATGAMNANGVFVANTVLAKHDENYMPPEVAEAMEMAKQRGEIAPHRGGQE